ncbi:MAG: protein kinase [Kofleriaceae bacterium]|nr:protein kinase [Kofleriaceae bacterium]MBP9166407.1 protein kinase [Kofleriaceae bacterium]MBP9858648.1 protein kinase [Kofleriaceae bacterium]
MACLDDNTAVAFATGELTRPQVAEVEAHLATCRDCRTLVAALAPAPGEPDSDLATPVRPALGKRGARDLALASTDARRGSEPRRALEPAVAVGDTIGRYVVLRRIGAGGMGVVFAAYDPQLDRRVALKLLRTGIGLGEGEARARLVREAQAIAQLSHPHVVAVYDVGTAVGGDVYIAMEFVEGDTLTSWLRAWDRTWREVVAIFLDAGRGLAAAHAVGLLHRDFKPDNVLVGADGRVRVTDFGLARSLMAAAEDGELQPTPELAALRVTLTATGAVMGTPRYMAPEQLAGKDVSAAADQFSFCVALYEAVYGVHPILGDTAAKMLEGGARMRPPPENRRVPTALLAILRRGLDPVPARRFPSMPALLAELTTAIRPPRRRYLVLAGAAALVLGGAAAATALAPRPSAPAADPAELEALRRQIEVLNEEKAQLKAQIQTAVDRDRAQVAALSALVEAADQRIRELEQQLEGAKVATAPPPRRPPPPVRRSTVSESQINAAAAPIAADVRGCFAEWRERSRELEAEAALVVRVFPDGRVRRVDVDLPDGPAMVCLTAAVQRITLPATEQTTVFRLTYRAVGDQLTATVDDLRAEAPPALIEAE